MHNAVNGGNLYEMQTINLDASDWTDVQIFYGTLLNALDAPFWHGKNINALIDSIVWGDINGVEPPYTICISNFQKASSVVREEVEALIIEILSSKAEHYRMYGHEPDVFLELH